MKGSVHAPTNTPKTWPACTAFQHSTAALLPTSVTHDGALSRPNTTQSCQPCPTQPPTHLDVSCLVQVNLSCNQLAVGLMADAVEQALHWQVSLLTS